MTPKLRCLQHLMKGSTLKAFTIAEAAITILLIGLVMLPMLQMMSGSNGSEQNSSDLQGLATQMGSQASRRATTASGMIDQLVAGDFNQSGRAGGDNPLINCFREHGAETGGLFPGHNAFPFLPLDEAVHISKPCTTTLGGRMIRYRWQIQRIVRGSHYNSVQVQVPQANRFYRGNLFVYNSLGNSAPGNYAQHKPDQTIPFTLFSNNERPQPIESNLITTISMDRSGSMATTDANTTGLSRIEWARASLEHFAKEYQCNPWVNKANSAMAFTTWANNGTWNGTRMQRTPGIRLSYDLDRSGIPTGFWYTNAFSDRLPTGYSGPPCSASGGNTARRLFSFINTINNNLDVFPGGQTDMKLSIYSPKWLQDQLHQQRPGGIYNSQYDRLVILLTDGEDTAGNVSGANYANTSTNFEYLTRSRFGWCVSYNMTPWQPPAPTANPGNGEVPYNTSWLTQYYHTGDDASCSTGNPFSPHTPDLNRMSTVFLIGMFQRDPASMDQWAIQRMQRIASATPWGMYYAVENSAKLENIFTAINGNIELFAILRKGRRWNIVP